jgi:hypothetical protein
MDWLYWLNWVCVSPSILLAILYEAYCFGQAVE